MLSRTRSVSMPVGTVSTYVGRREKLKELERNVEVVSSQRGPPHVVTVTGDEGTGKTQLVLRYVEKHKTDYDQVLWLDARSDASLRSGFERCCAEMELRISPGSVSSDRPLQHVPPVQAVVQRLSDLTPDQRWLVVVDNLRDEDLVVTKLSLASKTDLTIVIGRKLSALGSLNSSGKGVQLEGMTSAEALSLFQKTVSESSANGNTEFMLLSQQIINRLDFVPAAVDLAGARVRAGFDNGEDLVGAGRRYLAELDRAGGYALQKAWEVSMSATHEIERDRPDISAFRMLTFLASFHGNRISVDIFRLASLRLRMTSEQMDIYASGWLRSLLDSRTDGSWDDSRFRADVKMILNTGLVQYDNEAEDVLIMHDYVRTRLGQAEWLERSWPWRHDYLLVITAAILESGESNLLRYRQQILPHIPNTTALLTGYKRPYMNVKNLGRAEPAEFWMSIGEVWEAENRLLDAERLFSAALRVYRKARNGNNERAQEAAQALASVHRKLEQFSRTSSLKTINDDDRVYVAGGTSSASPSDAKLPAPEGYSHSSQETGAVFESPYVVPEEQYVDLSSVIHQNSTDSIFHLLHDNFGAVASGPWQWLHELRDEGFSNMEIAELLLQQHNDHPWIYFDHEPVRDNFPQRGLHVKGCVHDGGASSEVKKGRSDPAIDTFRLMSLADPMKPQLGVHETVASLCGLAGILPPSSRNQPWSGEVIFQDEICALVSYHQKGVTRGTMWNRIRDAAQRFCSAFAELQQSGHCCDSFTFLRSSTTATGSVQEPCVELGTIDSHLMLDFLTSLRGTDFSDRQARSCGLSARLLLNSAFNSLESGVQLFDLPGAVSTEEHVDLCALAVQVLCLGFVSYCQAHTGALRLFFMEYQLTEIRLFGAGDISSASPSIVARLCELTCFGSMLGDAVLVFDSVPAQKGDFIRDEAVKFNLLASPEDIVDTWGPGGFVMAMDAIGESKIISILIGGGCISLDTEQPNTYHWGPELQLAFDQAPTMRRKDKIVVATSIAVNPECHLDEEECFRICDEYRDPLGTYEAFWTMVERQAGLQAGLYATAVYNQTWAKRAGRILKESLILDLELDVLPFLESTSGLQVSFCSGLARRVRMRVLMAEVLPAFVQQKVLLPAQWVNLRDSLQFLNILREGDLKGWLRNAELNHHACYELACVLIRAVARLLQYTGIDQSEKHFIVAWFPSLPGISPQCIRIPPDKTNYWTRVLQDSSDCATFAYFTSACLQISSCGCRKKASSWHGEMALIETEVHRHVDGPHATLEWPWKLQDGQSYPIGHPELNRTTQLKARVEISDPLQIPRFVVSPSGVPLHYMNRIMLKQRSRKERLRERLTSLDKVQRAIIASTSSV